MTTMRSMIKWLRHWFSLWIYHSCIVLGWVDNSTQMANFGLENDIHSTLRLDVPISIGQVARWQRKRSSSSSSMLSGLSPGKCGNASIGSSKTPGRTPGNLFICGLAWPYCQSFDHHIRIFVCILGKNKRHTPSRIGGDRYIPVRNSKQMEVASFLISKGNDSAETALTVSYCQLPPTFPLVHFSNDRL